MYRKEDLHQLTFQDFYLPFGGELSGENRWVILAERIPWQRIDQQYGELFSEDEGCPAKAARVGFGALLIKERLGTTDRETVEQIRENPYLQYFLGFAEYRNETPFHHSMMTHFRKRFSKEVLAEINDMIVAAAMNQDKDVAAEPSDDDDKPSNNGKLIVDATCAPADMTYPTDLNLLNDAREKTEAIIDTMHAPFIGKQRKPRTYRQRARKDYLAVAKQKKPGYQTIRKAIGKQLRYLKRNLNTIAKRVEEGLLWLLGKRMYRNLLVIQELYRQHVWMHENRRHSIADRIVSISQPHVRPMVRGKAKSRVEFGAKISVSLVNGFSFVDRISWDSYNESGDLKSQIESYRRRFGFYPQSVHADQIYRTRDNRRYCKKHGIRLSGPPLGRPKTMTEVNASELKEQRRIHRQDELDWIAIEGKFGQGKRRFTLDRIMTKLARTSEAAITMAFIVMNLERILSSLFYFWLGLCSICRLGVRACTAGDRNWHWTMQTAA
jgi:hypothetical protein